MKQIRNFPTPVFSKLMKNNMQMCSFILVLVGIIAFVSAAPSTGQPEVSSFNLDILFSTSKLIALGSDNSYTKILQYAWDNCNHQQCASGSVEWHASLPQGVQEGSVIFSRPKDVRCQTTVTGTYSGDWDMRNTLLGALSKALEPFYADASGVPMNCDVWVSRGGSREACVGNVGEEPITVNDCVGGNYMLQNTNGPLADTGAYKCKQHVTYSKDVGTFTETYIVESIPSGLAVSIVDPTHKTVGGNIAITTSCDAVPPPPSTDNCPRVKSIITSVLGHFGAAGRYANTFIQISASC